MPRHCLCLHGLFPPLVPLKLILADKGIQQSVDLQNGVVLAGKLSRGKSYCPPWLEEALRGTFSVPEVRCKGATEDQEQNILNFLPLTFSDTAT